MSRFVWENYYNFYYSIVYMLIYFIFSMHTTHGKYYDVHTLARTLFTWFGVISPLTTHVASRSIYLCTSSWTFLHTCSTSQANKYKNYIHMSVDIPRSSRSQFNVDKTSCHYTRSSIWLSSNHCITAQTCPHTLPAVYIRHPPIISLFWFIEAMVEA